MDLFKHKHENRVMKLHFISCEYLDNLLIALHLFSLERLVTRFVVNVEKEGSEYLDNDHDHDHDHNDCDPTWLVVS